MDNAFNYVRVQCVLPVSYNCSPVVGPGKKAYVPPLHYFPIEYQPLQTGENEGELGVSQGTLRYFIDMVGAVDISGTFPLFLSLLDTHSSACHIRQQ